MRILPVILIALIICRCGSRDSRIVYDGDVLARATIRPVANILNDSFVFSWPRDVIIIDSLLIVHDSYNQMDGFHIFNKYRGDHLKSFGKRGRGPGEFVDVNSVNYNHDGRAITVFDPNLKKMIVFDVYNILSNTEPRLKEFYVSRSPNFVKQMLLHKEKFIAKGNSDKMRFGIWNSVEGDFIGLYTTYPKFTDDCEANWSIADYSAKIRLSPDGSKLVTATYIGGVLEIFDVKDDGFKQLAAHYFFEPVYDYAQGAVPRWVTTKSESVIGFEDVFVVDEAIYALLWGIKKSSMNDSIPSIIKFDLSGNTLCKLVFSEVIESFAVDNNGDIFGVARDSQGRYCLNKYTLR